MQGCLTLFTTFISQFMINDSTKYGKTKNKIQVMSNEAQTLEQLEE